MNTNCIHCTNSKGRPQSSIRLTEIAYDERVKFVECVCAALIDSRFGPQRISPLVISLTDRPDHRETVFYDVCEGEPGGLVPCYALSPLGHEDLAALQALCRRARQIELINAGPAVHNSPTDLTPNQGRGSPRI